MAKDEIIKKLETENLKVVVENKRLKEFIRSIKILLEQDNIISPS